MALKTTGIHHITAFAGHPQANVDFYAGVLGLRLIKKTINFDAPEVYHLYFGNETGSPGTAITFFPADGTPKGRAGGGQVGVTSYVVPPGSFDFWEKRLESFDIPVQKVTRFDEEVLQFEDNEGLGLELVEREAGVNSTWSFSGIPTDHAIKGFGGATLFSVDPERTAQVLTDVMGLEKVTEDEQYARFRAHGDIGNVIDVPLEAMARGMGGAGTVHHIAWRAVDDAEHEAWRRLANEKGYRSTGIIDRNYFKAIYFREDGGVLFEIATDPPGFTADEPLESLGEKLMLPPWLEPQRELIEANLLPIKVKSLEGDQS